MQAKNTGPAPSTEPDRYRQDADGETTFMSVVPDTKATPHLNFVL